MILGESSFYLGNKKLTESDIKKGLSKAGKDVIRRADEKADELRNRRIGTFFDKVDLFRTEMKLERPDDDTLASLMQIMYFAEKKGIIINYDTNSEKLSFHIKSDRYLGHGGRPARVKVRKDENGRAAVITCDEIILMMQSMKDREIIEKTGLSRATYYRRKKKMLASYYYSKLDKSRLSDKEYLKSQGHVPNF